MLEIIILELISLVSFIYALILIFIKFSPMSQLAGVFIWTVISAIIISYSLGKSKFHSFTILLLLAPLILYRDINYILLVLTTTIVVSLYIQSSLKKGKYLAYVDMFKKTMILYIVLLYLKILSTMFHWFLGGESIYLIIYLLSSIVLIRSIRHLDTNMDSLSIRNSNRKYILAIIGVFIIGTMESFRDILVKLATKTFEAVEFLVYIVVYPIIKFMTWFFGIFEDMESEPEEIIFGESVIPDITEPEVIEGFVEYTQNNYLVLKIIAATILFIIVIYILYKLLSKTGGKNYIGLEYTEHREFIKDEKKKRRRFFGERYPKEPKEQIRYYYRKFLEKLDKEEIEIKKQDTSYDVNKKAINSFGKEVHDIRALYIDSRYRDGKVGKDDVEKMKELYKNL